MPKNIHANFSERNWWESCCTHHLCKQRRLLHSRWQPASSFLVRQWNPVARQTRSLEECHLTPSQSSGRWCDRVCCCHDLLPNTVPLSWIFHFHSRPGFACIWEKRQKLQSMKKMLCCLQDKDPLWGFRTLLFFRPQVLFCLHRNFWKIITIKKKNCQENIQSIGVVHRPTLPCKYNCYKTQICRHLAAAWKQSAQYWNPISFLENTAARRTVQSSIVVTTTGARWHSFLVFTSLPLKKTK